MLSEAVNQIHRLHRYLMLIRVISVDTFIIDPDPIDSVMLSVLSRSAQNAVANFGRSSRTALWRIHDVISTSSISF